jgi:hypothetical protein
MLEAMTIIIQIAGTNKRFAMAYHRIVEENTSRDRQRWLKATVKFRNIIAGGDTPRFVHESMVDFFHGPQIDRFQNIQARDQMP